MSDATAVRRHRRLSEWKEASEGGSGRRRSSFPPVTEFAKALSRFLNRLEISEYELATRAGLSNSYVSRLMNGDRWPTRDTVERLASALEIDEYDQAYFFDLAGYSYKGRR